MRKLLYILPVLLILGFAACENYVDITPTGKKTVDSTETYYELVALPNRSYYPSSFALLSDNVWSKESNIIGKEYLSSDGINMTFNEDADRKELSDNNLYANCYQYILRSNIVISLVDHSTGDKHQCSRCKAAVDAAAGVGQHHLLHAQQLQNIKGVTDLFHGVALVKVEAALQRIDLLFAQLTHQQSTLMPLYRGHGKIWNIPVGEFFCFRKISGQVAKAGAQHHGDLRTFGSA